MKQTSRKPESSEDKPRNKNPANPRAMDMSDCTQNAPLSVHVLVSLTFRDRASSVPAEFADINIYANT